MAVGMMMGNYGNYENYKVGYAADRTGAESGARTGGPGEAPEVIGSRGSRDVNGNGRIDPSECETCKNRKYMDGSGEGDVSFKAPGHISPGQSYGKVMSHELQHVANARERGARKDSSLVSASVSLKMAVCPECGTSYVAGGTTRTQVRYEKDNPYASARKIAESSVLAGMNFDYEG